MQPPSQPQPARRAEVEDIPDAIRDEIDAVGQVLPEAARLLLAMPGSSDLAETVDHFTARLQSAVGRFDDWVREDPAGRYDIRLWMQTHFTTFGRTLRPFVDAARARGSREALDAARRCLDVIVICGQAQNDAMRQRT